MHKMNLKIDNYVEDYKHQFGELLRFKICCNIDVLRFEGTVNNLWFHNGCFGIGYACNSYYVSFFMHMIIKKVIT